MIIYLQHGNLMKEQFTQFNENIRLTSNQIEDAKTKYRGVCKKLHDNYYDNSYDGKTKLLFGSYKTKTNVRPMSENQDVDVIFKITKDKLEQYQKRKGNGPSFLLHEIRELLKNSYTTSEEPKAWGKIVLIKTAEKYHNVELLPGYENENGTFIIPNSENGGSWEQFNPRKQLDDFLASNKETKGLTANLTRMIKTWVNNTATLEYKSFFIQNDVIEFLVNNYNTGADFSDYQYVVRDFFDFLLKKDNEFINSYVLTALDRSNKAIEYYDVNKPKEASEEWGKIFGSNKLHAFPPVEQNPVSENKVRIITNPSQPYAENRTNTRKY